ncbi:MAG: hypothetical protein AB7S78_05895 [Candidatus Omnitrophota bacterium]
MKRLSIIFLFFLSCGCASYERRINLVPQEANGWKKNHSRYYEASCGDGTIWVNNIVVGYEGGGDMPFFIPIPAGKETLKKANAEDAWLYMGLISKNPIESCDLSFLFLENQITGDHYRSTHAEILGGGNKWEGKNVIRCYYYFDLPKDSHAGYNLHVSEDVFNCSINPLPLKHDKSFEVIPMQVM